MVVEGGTSDLGLVGAPKGNIAAGDPHLSPDIITELDAIK